MGEEEACGCPRGPGEICSQAGEAVGWEGRRASHIERGPGGWKRLGRDRAYVGMVLGLGEASREAGGELWAAGRALGPGLSQRVEL